MACTLSVKGSQKQSQAKSLIINIPVEPQGMDFLEWVSFVMDASVLNRAFKRGAEYTDRYWLGSRIIHYQTVGNERVDMLIHLSDTEARESGRFSHSLNQLLKVPEGFFNYFIKQTLERSHGGSIGFHFSYRDFDRDLFWSWWKSAGFPLEVPNNTIPSPEFHSPRVDWRAELEAYRIAHKDDDKEIKHVKKPEPEDQ